MTVNHFIIGTTALAAVLFGIFLDQYVGLFITSSDFINYYGFSLTIIAIASAMVQSNRNHDWNRRQLASSSLLGIKEKVTPHILRIHQHFGYMTRHENDTIKILDIHNKICEKVGDQFVVDECTRMHKLKEDDESKALHRSIWEALNHYEYIASGVYQGVYDKQIVEDLLASNIIKIASVFSEYIEHVNSEMYPYRENRLWENIRALGAEMKKEFRKEVKPKKRPAA